MRHLHGAGVAFQSSCLLLVRSGPSSVSSWTAPLVARRVDVALSGVCGLHRSIVQLVLERRTRHDETVSHALFVRSSPGITRSGRHTPEASEYAALLRPARLCADNAAASTTVPSN